MTPEKQQELNHHLDAIAKILYEEAEPENLQSLEGIEETIRCQSLEYIMPQLGFFLSEKQRELRQGDGEKSVV